MNKDKGFTLLEVMVTVVIIGILATLAAVNFAPQIEKQRSAEAIEVLLKAYAGYQRRILDDETLRIYTPPGSPATRTARALARLGMSNPNVPANRFFNYGFTGIVGQVPSGLNATRIGAANQWLWINLTIGQITKTAPY